MLNAVVDISHYSTITSFAAVKQAGILGVIQKATQGLSYQDPTFAAHKAGVQGAGMLFGAYHFGTAGDASAQADYFLQAAGDTSLLVLDFEANTQGQSMSLVEAEEFVHHVWARTGRYPGLYSGHDIKQALQDAGITQPNQTELSKCWLWIAQYSSAPPLIPPVWNQWTLWQYTDGAAGSGPYSVDGIGRCDRSQFQGTADQLQAFWPAPRPPVQSA